MKWNSLVLPCPQFGASQKSRRLPISGSASRCLIPSGSLRSGSGGAACTTGLTWTRGSKNISAEGGPERSIYGP